MKYKETPEQRSLRLQLSKAMTTTAKRDKTKYSRKKKHKKGNRSDDYSLSF